MKIAIVGTGAIGSTFALHLARDGHDVTVVARGQRLARLQTDRAIVPLDGAPAPVTVAPSLDESIAYDLVLVTVMAAQVRAVLPSLKASAAATVMFMFNTFEPLRPLRDAVGDARFAFGFPGILATLPDGKLRSKVFSRGQSTISTDASWAKVFTHAGIYTAVVSDMESWLRTHAVLIAPTMGVAVLAHARQRGISWSEATLHARAMHEGFALVRSLGNEVTPSTMRWTSRLPVVLLAFLLWVLSRFRFVRELGAAGPAEPRALVDEMIAVAPDRTALLRAARPPVS